MIGVLENAMLARIAAASTANAIPYAYRTVETWPKAFDDYLSARVVQYPACWAFFGGAHSIERVARGRWRVRAAFGLVVAAESLRNEEARRHGGTAAEPGSYQLAVDALRILADQNLGLDIDVLTPTSIMPVETHDIPKMKQISIYAVSFETGLYYDSLPTASDLAAFTTFHANWDPAPFGHVDRSAIPDDDGAVGTDHIQLPQ